MAPDYHPPCEEDPSGHWSKQEKEYVDQLCYQVVQRSTGAVMAMWGVPGDLMTGGEDVVQQNNMFQMHMRGGWLSSEPLIKTAPGPDPLLALMVAAPQSQAHTHARTRTHTTRESEHKQHDHTTEGEAPRQQLR